jgi:hypothetical protein
MYTSILNIHKNQFYKIRESRDGFLIESKKPNRVLGGYRSAVSTFSKTSTTSSIEKEQDMSPASIFIPPTAIRRFNNMADPSVAIIVRNGDKKERSMSIQERQTLYMNGWFSTLIKRRKILKINRSKSKSNLVSKTFNDENQFMDIDAPSIDKTDDCEDLTCSLCHESICENTLLTNPHQNLIATSDIDYKSISKTKSNCTACICIKCLLTHSFKCRGMQQLPSCPFCRQTFDESTLVPFSVQYIT